MQVEAIWICCLYLFALFEKVSNSASWEVVRDYCLFHLPFFFRSSFVANRVTDEESEWLADYLKTRVMMHSWYQVQVPTTSHHHHIPGSSQPLQYLIESLIWYMPCVHITNRRPNIIGQGKTAILIPLIFTSSSVLVHTISKTYKPWASPQTQHQGWSSFLTGKEKSQAALSRIWYIRERYLVFGAP